MTATFPLEIGVEAHYYLLPGMETSRTTYYYARLPTSVGALGWSSAKIPKQKMRQYYGRMYCPNSPLINELGRITAKIPKQKLRQYYGRMYCPNSPLINKLGRITAKIPKQKLRQYYGRMYRP